MYPTCVCLKRLNICLGASKKSYSSHGTFCEDMGSAFTVVDEYVMSNLSLGLA